MKIRRITLAALLLITLLFALDVRYFTKGDPAQREPSIHFSLGGPPRLPQVQKEVDFVQPQGAFTSLLIEGHLGTVDLKSVDDDQLRIKAIIWADSDHGLELLNVLETISGSEVRYALVGEAEDLVQNAGISFVAGVPAGMEVTIEQAFGEVKVEDFVGFLNLETSFSNVQVDGLQGTMRVANSFGELDLRGIRGPLRLEDAYGTSRVQLLSMDGGYTFDIEVANGVLLGNAPLQMDTARNKVTAFGQSDQGVHPIVIRSSYGRVTVNVEE